MKGVAQKRKRKENPYNKHHPKLGNYESIPFKIPGQDMDILYKYSNSMKY